MFLSRHGYKYLNIYKKITIKREGIVFDCYDNDFNQLKR